VIRSVADLLWRGIIGRMAELLHRKRAGFSSAV